MLPEPTPLFNYRIDDPAILKRVAIGMAGAYCGLKNEDQRIGARSMTSALLCELRRGDGLLPEDEGRFLVILEREGFSWV